MSARTRNYLAGLLFLCAIIIGSAAAALIPTQPVEGREFFITVDLSGGVVPQTIRVLKGDAILLRVLGIEPASTLKIPGYGVEIELIPGVETLLELTVDKAGTFPVYTDYDVLVAELIVEE